MTIAEQPRKVTFEQLLGVLVKRGLVTENDARDLFEGQEIQLANLVRQRRQEIGMTRQEAETAAFVGGAHRPGGGFVHQHVHRRGDGQVQPPGHAALCPCRAAISLARASSKVPTM